MEQTMLYGNGLNYLSLGAIGWDDLLKILMREEQFDMTLLPNIMSYERIRLTWNKSTDTTHLKSKISELLDDQPTNDFYKKLLTMNIKNFLSTNYDYAMNKSLPLLKNVNNSTEEIYSIRRNTSLFIDGTEIAKIWNIHGEINHPKSIMLGLNHYCGSIGKIDGYLKGTYDFRDKGQKLTILPIEEKLETNSFDSFSWIELLFMSNVHIAGFGLDFSEIDLWWILNKRARLKEQGLIKNKIFYYTKPIDEVNKGAEVEKRKREMLDAFDVKVVTTTTKSGYDHQWRKIIEEIENNHQ